MVNSPLQTDTASTLPSLPSPDEDALYAVVQGRTLAGVLSLAAREGAVTLLAFGGSIILARLLSPEIFGLYAIASFAISFFSLFGELGLGAALIRQAEQVTSHVLNAIFTLQLTFSLILALILFSIAPVIGSIYQDSQISWLIRALAIAFVATLLRSVPIIRAERELDYKIVAITDISTQIIYWVVVLPIAMGGRGVWSLVIATIASTVGGTLVLYIRSKWKPALNFRWHPLKPYLQFGLFFQGQSIAHFMKDSLIPSLGGVLYGSAAVGYLTWANQIAATPLQLTHIVSRVSYPAMARLQHDRQALTRLLENAFSWTCKLTFPLFAVLGGLAPQFTEYIYGAQWYPSLYALYIFEINMMLGICTGLFLPVLYSSGRAGIALAISLGWTTLTIVFILLLFAIGIGFNAIAIAYTTATAISTIVIIIEARKVMSNLRVFRPLVYPLAAMLIITLLLRATAQFVIGNLLSLIMLALVAGLVGLVLNTWRDRYDIYALLVGFLRTTTLRRRATS